MADTDILNWLDQLPSGYTLTLSADAAGVILMLSDGTTRKAVSGRKLTARQAIQLMIARCESND